MPCRIRLGMAVLLTSPPLRGFLVQHGLDAGNVTADGAHAGGVFKLAGGLLEAQVEGLLLQRNQLVAQLVGRLVFSSWAFMRLFLSTSPEGPASGHPESGGVHVKTPQ